MNKKVAKELYNKANETAFHFSNPDRQFNTTKETFKVGKIKPLSENTAALHFNKSSGKIGVAFFYYIRASNGRWEYFFPSDSHIIGMSKMGDILHDVELYNFDKNFTGQEKQ